MRKHKSDFRFFHLIAVLLFLSVSAWLGAGFYQALHRRLFSPAEAVAASAPILLQGIALRREALVGASADIPAVPDGKRIAAGTVLARSTDGSVIRAPASALFFSDWDGWEAFGPESSETENVSALRSLLAQRPEKEKNACGRLVLDPVWYFAALADADTAPEVEQRCLLRFAELSAPLPALVTARSGEEDGLVAVCFRLDRGDAAAYRLRLTRAELITEYTGPALSG